MQQQFILRLPEALKGVKPGECRLVKSSEREVCFMVGETPYPGVIYRLPTIVETQKVVDNKLYKIADLSTLIVVYEDSSFDLQEEIQKYESSGLTPPMHNARERRFTKTTVRTEDVEMIERKVVELLRADSKALKVEIVTSEETDIDVLAAEIENELAEKPAEAVPAPEPVEVPAPEEDELLEKIREKQEQVDKAVNPILKKRFEQALASLKEEYARKRGDTKGHGSG